MYEYEHIITHTQNTCQYEHFIDFCFITDAPFLDFIDISLLFFFFFIF